MRFKAPKSLNQRDPLFKRDVIYNISYHEILLLKKLGASLRNGVLGLEWTFIKRLWGFNAAKQRFKF